MVQHTKTARTPGLWCHTAQAARVVCTGKVSFVNMMGILEAGLDHGGLVKEFLEEVHPQLPVLWPHSAAHTCTCAFTLAPTCRKRTEHVVNVLLYRVAIKQQILSRSHLNVSAQW